MEHTGGGDEPLGPVDPLVVPRFAGPATFARLPRLDQVDRCDVAVVGVPFDAGTTYRPGARFGPARTVHTLHMIACTARTGTG